MKCRKNLRTLFAEYIAASADDKPNTALMKLKNAILALKNSALHPSQLISRPDVAADIANDIAGGMLGPGSTLLSRYDDFVWVHHQVMMLGPNDPNGPNYAHRGPAFGPWHRELLKLFEAELQNAAGDPNLTLPYWDWTKDRSAADPGFPFTTDFLGGDGAGNPNDKVMSSDFSQAAGWVLNCDEEGFGYLRRHFGGDGPGLPTPDSVKNALAITPYDRSPWNRNSASATSFRNTLEGWVGARQIHNAVHRWVDGSMQPGTSPNDPVFFLHHCNIDRLWAVWEQKNPGAAPYLPDNTTPAANGLTRLNENMSTLGRTATDRYFGVDVTPGGVVNNKAITWYDTDLPDVNNETGGTLVFTDIPEGLTSYKAVKFRITGCRPARFRIVGVPTGNFGLTSMGTEFMANPDDNADFFFGYVWVQLTAVAGPIAPSSVDIHAYIIDQEGYYAATEGGEYPLGDFHVTLTATTVPRENNSVVLVLDRSGSMADPAGGISTKSALLKNAVSVFNSLMLPNDEIALVSFDDLIATPAPMQAAGNGAVPPVLAGTDLDPRGLTCIGGGILQGSTELGLATTPTGRWWS
jgi:tyrosinase-like protein